MFVKITRYLSISALAISITLGCFLLMQQLLHQADNKIVESPEYHPITFVDMEIPDYDPPPPRPKKPEHEPPPEVLTPTTDIPVAENKPVTTIARLNLLDSLQGTGPGYTGWAKPNTNSGADNDRLVQLFTITPPYPVTAARAGIEGWVKIQFSVNAAGMVSDPIVIDSQPKRVFDQAAVAAVLKWRFQPRSFNAPSLSAVQVIDFTLENN